MGSIDFSFIFQPGFGGSGAFGPEVSLYIPLQRRRLLHYQSQLLRRHGPKGESRTSPLHRIWRLFLGIERTYLCFRVAIFINATEISYIGQTWGHIIDVALHAIHIPRLSPRVLFHFIFFFFSLSLSESSLQRPQHVFAETSPRIILSLWPAEAVVGFERAAKINE